MDPWPASAPGVVTLPSGRRVRGRGRRRDAPGVDGLLPMFGLYLLAAPPPPEPWPSWWLAWPDFRLPRDPDDAVAWVRGRHHPRAVETPGQRRFVRRFGQRIDGP